jgi:hypothetical protein
MRREGHLVGESRFGRRCRIQVFKQSPGGLSKIRREFFGQDEIAAESVFDSVAGGAGFARGGDGAAGFGAVDPGDSAAAF